MLLFIVNPSPKIVVLTKVAWRKVLSDFWSNIEFSTWFTLVHGKFEWESCSLSVTRAFISGTSSVTDDSHTCNQITVLFYLKYNNSQIFFAVGLNSSKRMSHQIRRNSNSVSSSPTHPQAKVDILINNKRNSHFISTHQSSPAVEPAIG